MALDLAGEEEDAKQDWEEDMARNEVECVICLQVAMSIGPEMLRIDACEPLR
jgi:hypothetical protein